MYTKPFTLIATLLLSTLLYAGGGGEPAKNSVLVTNYIEQFKDLAILEMQRTGIPASIKLAQGMFESSFGQSKLAIEGNNHFGIKCKSDWLGEIMHYTDDSLDECFRKYPTAYDSYKDHSDFLMSRKHYASLFTLAPGDYRGWAEGLKKAGYATDERYKEKIIQIIETYALYQYDNMAFYRPLVYADSICFNNKGEWVVLEQPITQNEDLGAILPILSTHNGGSIFAYANTKDLKTIDDLLAKSVVMRPKGMELKCLRGSPAISVQIERIRPGFKPLVKGNLGQNGNNDEKKGNKVLSAQLGTGRQLNPFFNPGISPPPASEQATNEEKPAVNTAPITSVAATSPIAPATPVASKTTTLSNSSPVATPAETGNAKVAATPVKEQHATKNTTTTALYPQAAETTQRATSAAVNTSNKATTAAATAPKKTKITYKPDMSNENLTLPKQKYYNINGVQAVSYPYSVLPSQIAQTYRLGTHEVLRNNDMQDNTPIPAQTHIFLQLKKDKTDKDDKCHTVAANETLWQIAQKYGVTLESLCQRNKLEIGKQPVVGQKLYLRNTGIQLPKVLVK